MSYLLAIEQAVFGQPLQTDHQNIAGKGRGAEYGELPAPTGCSGRTCHSVCLAAASQSTKS